MTTDTIRWTEALAEGIDPDTLSRLLAYGRHYHDVAGEVYWLHDDLAELLALIEAEGRPQDDA
jgi:hypothetical protein